MASSYNAMKFNIGDFMLMALVGYLVYMFVANMSTPPVVKKEDSAPYVPMPTKENEVDESEEVPIDSPEIRGTTMDSYESAPMDLSNPDAARIETGCEDGQFISSHLLPKKDPKLEDDWSEFSPGNALQQQNFIDAARLAKPSVLRNANLQIRSEPPNPRQQVCAWMNTTIGPDQDRRPLEIGN